MATRHEIFSRPRLTDNYRACFHLVQYPLDFLRSGLRLGRLRGLSGGLLLKPNSNVSLLRLPLPPSHKAGPKGLKARAVKISCILTVFLASILKGLFFRIIKLCLSGCDSDSDIAQCRQ